MMLSISRHELQLLRHSAELLSESRPSIAAERVYDAFSALPDASAYLYDLPLRIQSTKALIELMIAEIEKSPFASTNIHRVFVAIGVSHYRAGLPLPLLEGAPDIFARCLAEVADTSQRRWLPSYTRAWRTLFRAGVAIQREAYQDQERQIS
jgi:hypothetical protein